MRLNNIQGVILRLSLVFSLFSVLDLTNSILQADKIRYLLFIALAIVVLWQNKLSVKLTPFMKIYIVFITYLLITMLLTRIMYNFKGMNYFLTAMLPLFIYTVCCNCDDSILDDFDGLIKTYIVCVFIMSIIIIGTFDYSTWLQADQYQYDAGLHKNLVGQVLGTAFILAVFVTKKNNIIDYCLNYGFAVAIVVAMIFVQCRSALIGVVLSCAVFVLTLSKHKVRDIAIVAIITLLLLNSDKITEAINHSFFIDKYSVEGQLDLDKFSSGRTNHWLEAIEMFNQFPIIGCQAYYVDNFWISLLVNTGILGAMLGLVLFISRIYNNIFIFRKSDQSDSLGRAAVLILTFSLTISMFEANPPFGPGVSSVFFWITAAMVDKKLKLAGLSRQLVRK